jgi:broad specificity phosphatase PhoE
MIVSHGSFLSVLLSEALQLPMRPVWSLQLGNAAMLHVRIRRHEPGAWPLATIVVPGPAVPAEIQGSYQGQVR